MKISLCLKPISVPITMNLVGTTIAMALLSTVPCLADTYTFEETEERAPLAKNAESIAAPLWQKSKNRTKTVRLGRTALAIDSEHKRTIFDFADNKVYKLEPDLHRYSTASLYATVAFRGAELGNRYMLNDLLARTGVKNGNTLNRFFAEEELGMVGKRLNSGYKLQKRQANGITIYENSGQVVTKFEPGNVDLKGENARQFSLFLIHDTAIHPTIRKDIEEAGKQPKSLIWVSCNAPGTELSRTTIRMTRFEPGDYKVALPLDCKPYESAEDLLSPVFARLKQLGDKTPAKLKDEALKNVARYQAKKDAVDLLLTVSEYSIETGDQQPIANLRNVEHNSDFNMIVTGLATPNNTAEAVRALAALDQVDRKKYEKSYMLDLFRANLLLGLDSARAKFQTPYERDPVKAFIAVLKANPYLAGAYHDLGKCLFNFPDVYCLGVL